MPSPPLDLSSSASAAASVDAVAARMSELLEGFERAGDVRAVFLRSYRVITWAIRDRVAAEGFTDPAWVAALDVEFAQIYFDVLDDYAAGRAVPRCWKLAFDLGAQGRTTVLADLIFGLNAHILHDLPIAVWRLGLGSAPREVRHADYTRVDDLLVAEIDGVQQEVCRHYSFGLWTLDTLGHRGDELVTGTGLRAARTLSWTHGMALMDAPTDAARDALLTALDTEAVRAGQLFHAGSLAAPGFFTRLTRRFDRRLARLKWGT